MDWANAVKRGEKPPKSSKAAQWVLDELERIDAKEKTYIVQQYAAVGYKKT